MDEPKPKNKKIPHVQCQKCKTSFPLHLQSFSFPRYCKCGNAWSPVEDVIVEMEVAHP